MENVENDVLYEEASLSESCYLWTDQQIIKLFQFMHYTLLGNIFLDCSDPTLNVNTITTFIICLYLFLSLNNIEDF